MFVIFSLRLGTDPVGAICVEPTPQDDDTMQADAIDLPPPRANNSALASERPLLVATICTSPGMVTWDDYRTANSQN